MKIGVAGLDKMGTAIDCDGIRRDLRSMVAEADTRGFALPLAERTLSEMDAHRV